MLFAIDDPAPELGSSVRHEHLVAALERLIRQQIDRHYSVQHRVLGTALAQDILQAVPTDRQQLAVDCNQSKTRDVRQSGQPALSPWLPVARKLTWRPLVDDCTRADRIADQIHVDRLAGDWIRVVERFHSRRRRTVVELIEGLEQGTRDEKASVAQHEVLLPVEQHDQGSVSRAPAGHGVDAQWL